MAEASTPATAPQVRGEPEILVKQPEAKEELKVGPLTRLAEVVRPRRERLPTPPEWTDLRPRASPWLRRRRRCILRWNKVAEGIYVALVVIWRVFLGLGILVGVAVVFGITFGTSAANGAMWMLIGNAILRAAHLPGYAESNRIPAAIGAVGCIFAGFCVAIVASFLPKTALDRETGKRKHAWWIRPPAMVCVGALTGAIGASILKRHHYDLQGVDVMHATAAGALGATIMFPGLTFVVGLILTPLWVAMLMGLEFIYAKSNETITADGCHKFSYCIVFASCRDEQADPEIQEQLDRCNAVQRQMDANWNNDFGV